ncbi:MAG: hypothetical protein ACLPVY_23300 [Acidimicrobiia bacterium]
MNTVASTGELEELPTAKQSVAFEHDTALNVTSVTPAGVGLATIDQLVPSHRSISVCGVDVVDVSTLSSPTAKQLVELEHDTPTSSAPASPVRRGLATIDQLVPFQRSMNVPFPPAPTAKQSDALEHDTAESSPFGGPGGLTLGTTDQRAAAPDVGATPTTTPAINPTVTTSLTNVSPRAC